MKSKYKLPLAFVLVALVSATLAVVLWPHPKYVYAVRERIHTENNSVSWDLWCWREYPGGRINKTYVGHYKINGISEWGDGTESSLCPKKGVL